MRLIDANALRNVFDAMHVIEGVSRFDHLVLLGIKKYIDDAPTIDAVPVVRCRECIHRCSDCCPMCYEEYYYDEDDGGDWVTRDVTVDDGFCHLGAKMDGGAENV